MYLYIILNLVGGYATTCLSCSFLGELLPLVLCHPDSLEDSASRVKAGLAFMMHHSANDIPNLGALLGWFLSLIQVELLAMFLCAQVINTLKHLSYLGVEKSSLKFLGHMHIDSNLVNFSRQTKVSPRHLVME